MFDGCLLPLVFPCLLLLGGTDAATAGGAELEVVIPERVALEKIHLLPPAGRGDRGGGGPRRRRALRRAAEALLLLRLPAGGSELYLQLRRDLRFLARDFVVEQRRGEGRRAAGPRRPSEERLCFYTGHVLNRSDSFASLSTCAGLVLAARPDGCPPYPVSPRAPGAVGSFPAVPCLKGFVLGEMPHGGKKRLWGRAGASAPSLSISPQHLTTVPSLSTLPQHFTSVLPLSASPQPPVPHCVSGVPPVRAFCQPLGAAPVPQCLRGQGSPPQQTFTKGVWKVLLGLLSAPVVVLPAIWVVGGLCLPWSSLQQV